MNILLNKKFKRIEPEAVVLIEGSPLPKYTICIPILAHVNIQQMLTEIISTAENLPTCPAALVYHYHVATGGELSTLIPESNRSIPKGGSNVGLSIGHLVNISHPVPTSK